MLQILSMRIEFCTLVSVFVWLVELRRGMRIDNALLLLGSGRLTLIDLQHLAEASILMPMLWRYMKLERCRAIISLPQ